MTEIKEQFYIGSAKVKDYNGDKMVQISISLTELNKFRENPEYKKAKYKDKNGNEYLKLVAFPLKPENVKDWRTHSVKLDTYEQKDPSGIVKEQVQTQQPQSDEDLPF